MSKAIEGAAMIGAAFAMSVAAFFDPALLASPLYDKAMVALFVGGVAMEAGAIAQALTQNRGMNITTRQPAAHRQIIYGEQRVGGIKIYDSTTGGNHDQHNMVIVLAGHVCDSIVNLYLDGRQVHWTGSGPGNSTRNGVNFGGNADGNTYIGPGGQHYNFGTLVYCEARYGDQAPTDVIAALTANDPTWAYNPVDGYPVVSGCTYVYLKLEYDATMFPNGGETEIRFTVRGKNNILDPRTGLSGWSSNWALICADVLTDPLFGLGDSGLVIPNGVTNPGFEANAAGTPVNTSLAVNAAVGDGWTNGIATDTSKLVTLLEAGGIPNSGTQNLLLRVVTGQSIAAGALISTRVFSNQIPLDAGISTITASGFLGWYASAAIPAGIQIKQRLGVYFYDSSGTFLSEDYVDQTNTITSAYAAVTHVSSVPAAAATAVVQLAAFLQNTSGSAITLPASAIADLRFDDITITTLLPGVNTAQLIAAANVCDEQVALAAGGTESRYACHAHYDTATSPGDALNKMMPAAAGRMSRIGGQWFLWPAYWQGPSFSFDENVLAGPVQWNQYRSSRDLSNRVNGTYIAPNWPYNVAGNLYDKNGWYDGTTSNVFPFGFQPTNYPQYAQDVLHGYASDALLAADGGNQKPMEVTQECVLSIAQAQRLAKIMLLRNRQQGSGSFPMKLLAWEMQPLDVMQFSFAARHWTNKQLELTRVDFQAAEHEGTPALMLQVQVQETDQTVYEWTTREELSPYDVPQNPAGPGGPGQPPLKPPAPPPPHPVPLPLVGKDGVTLPAVALSWTAPADILTKQVQVQYQLAGAGSWTDSTIVDAANTATVVYGLVAGQTYNFRIRGLRAGGAVSDWAETDGVLVTATNSLVGMFTTNPASVLTAQAISGGTSGQAMVDGFTASINGVSVACAAGTVASLTQGQSYGIYYIDLAFAGGSPTYIATQNAADYLGKYGYYFLGNVMVPSIATLVRPTAYADLGDSTTIAPTYAFDASPTTAARVNGNWFAGLGTSANGDCLFNGFPSGSSGSALTLKVRANYNIATSGGGAGQATIVASIGGTPTTLLNVTSGAGGAVYTLNIPAGTNFNTVSVEVTASQTAGSSNATSTCTVLDIQIS